MYLFIYIYVHTCESALKWSETFDGCGFTKPVPSFSRHPLRCRRQLRLWCVAGGMWRLWTRAAVSGGWRDLHQNGRRAACFFFYFFWQSHLLIFVIVTQDRALFFLSFFLFLRDLLFRCPHPLFPLLTFLLFSMMWSFVSRSLLPLR
uniref:Uncharacterized protein n=1 Tax=Trypanosoma congolense (strain IL3000) TaxID=1068625 RepID=G0V1I2_TRYCI|nr:hypothetical protein, unlikely [Trypanosoma congolense IL3000]